MIEWLSKRTFLEITLHLTLEDALISMSLIKISIVTTLANIASSKFDRMGKRKELSENNYPPHARRANAIV